MRLTWRKTRPVPAPRYSNAEIREQLDNIKRRFVNGELSIAEAASLDRYWRTEQCINSGSINRRHLEDAKRTLGIA